MRRRVLHVISDSGQSGTSIARIVASLHRHIPHSEFEICACFVGSDGPLCKEFSSIGMTTGVVSWKHPSRDLSGAMRLAAFLFSSKYDLIHFHWGGPSLRRLGRMVANAKVLFHLHSSIEENLPSRPAEISTRNADAVVAVSRAVAASSSHRRTSVIYPGIEVPADTIREEARDLCGCALRLTPVKGITYLLQATALLKKDFPAFCLEIAGDGPSRNALEAEAKLLGIADRVRFLGWVDSLPELRARWAMMVQPSLEDGFPLSVVEAMADGIPVVGSRVGGLPEIIADNETGLLVPSADAPALANAMARLIRDSDLRGRLGSASVARVRERFSAQRMADETAQLYRQLLS